MKGQEEQREKMRAIIDEHKHIIRCLQTKLESECRRLVAAEQDLTEEMRHDYTTEQILGPSVYHASFTEYTDHDGPVLVYMGSYYIDIVDDGIESGYHLILGGGEYESQCLRELEDILADYARDEGQCYIEL